jgi:hypothetical protein
LFNIVIEDRVGGGDGFCSGFVYGLLHNMPPQECVEMGAAHGALLQSTRGGREQLAEIFCSPSVGCSISVSQKLLCRLKTLAFPLEYAKILASKGYTVVVDCAIASGKTYPTPSGR